MDNSRMFSETDVQLFRNLANTEKIDLTRHLSGYHKLERIPSPTILPSPHSDTTTHHSDGKHRHRHRRRKKKHRRHRNLTPPSGLTEPTPSVAQRHHENDDDKRSPQPLPLYYGQHPLPPSASTEQKPLTEPSHKPSLFEQTVQQQLQNTETIDNVSPPSPKWYPKTPASTQPVPPVEYPNDASSPTLHHSPSYGLGSGVESVMDMDVQHQKRKYLIELQKLKMQYNIQLTREYTMDDDLIDIRFEYESHQSNMDIVSHVNFMRNCLSVAFVLIELANEKVGPILELNGWSEHMRKDMKKFDRVLEKFYHMFWRKGQMSPYMEFGWLIFGSMLMWHVQNKYLGGFPVSSLMNNMGGSNPTTTRTNGSGGSGGRGGGSGSGLMSGLGSIFRMFSGGQRKTNAPEYPTGTSSQPTQPSRTSIVPPSAPRYPPQPPPQQPPPPSNTQPPPQRPTFRRPSVVNEGLDVTTPRRTSSFISRPVIPHRMPTSLQTMPTIREDSLGSPPPLTDSHPEPQPNDEDDGDQADVE